ncbi:MAG: hypothetical protein AAFP20_00750 [Cyanobacteria bacterium J06614_10]
MINLSTKRASGKLVQFSAYTDELPQQLENDVECSGYKTRTKYMNVLIDRVLSLQPRFGSQSRIGELFYLLDIIESLPLESIQSVAPEQNRNFDQMLRHLVKTALKDYQQHPETVSEKKH